MHVPSADLCPGSAAAAPLVSLIEGINDFSIFVCLPKSNLVMHVPSANLCAGSAAAAPLVSRIEGRSAFGSFLLSTKLPNISWQQSSCDEKVNVQDRKSVV